jgi:hypothetical protein
MKVAAAADKTSVVMGLMSSNPACTLCIIECSTLADDTNCVMACAGLSGAAAAIGADRCNDTLVVSGAEALYETTQWKPMGVYNKVADVTQGERPVYRQEKEGKHYDLFYWPGTRSWIIGSDYTKNQALLYAYDTAVPCPDMATGWKVYDGAAFVDTVIKIVNGGAPCPLPLPALSCAALSRSLAAPSALAASLIHSLTFAACSLRTYLALRTAAIGLERPWPP